MVELEKSAATADVFITDELHSRPPRKTDYLQEKLALQDLTRQMVDHPGQVLPRLVDLAMEICGSVSGGISLYEENPQPGLFRWHYLRGNLASFEGATTPRDFSPCGVCLDLNKPVLARRPEQLYPWISDAGISVPEVLLVPLYMGGTEPLGTLWIISEYEGHFDSGHARVLSELSAFAGIAFRMLRTEHRLNQALEHQETLTREMSHRVKNLFAITESMIRFSLRSATSAEDMARTLSGRLNALAVAHALVRRSFGDHAKENETAELGDLIRTILRPHEGAAALAESGRFSIDGPSILLGDRAANGLALVFHELATNAAKYGALKADEGSINVAWRHLDTCVAITWQEHGGPKIEAEPSRRGFGSTLSNGTVVGQLGGALSYDWQSAGLSVVITVPIENLWN